MLTILPATPHGAPCLPGCGSVHSYTADGARWCWQGAVRGRDAIDAEVATATPPPHLARRACDVDDFWAEWTRLEVVAKLTDTPVLALLGRHGLPTPVPAGIELAHLRLGDTLVCHGRWAS